MHSKIRGIVNKLIKKYKTNNPYELASYLNIILIEKPLGAMSGSYFYINRNKVIFLNSSLTDYEKILVLAHEIGHSILHKNRNCYFIKNKTLLLTSKIEKEANIFTAELLINDNLFLQYEGFTLTQIGCMENIPVELLKLKFFSLFKNTSSHF